MPLLRLVLETERRTIMPFLQKKIYYYLTLAVIATTLFSWFNLNSYLIILLLLCRLLDNDPRKALRTAFTNKVFLAYFSIFLLELAGLFYTHHLFVGWKQMESKATLVAIPFILCAGPFTDRAGYRRLLSAYCLLLAGVCLYCLSMAVVEYHWQKDLDVFFYHQLTSPVSFNAVFFSGYVLIAILFLLFSPDRPFARVSSFARVSPFATVPPCARWLRIALILFFTAIMVLLSSRLLLVLLVVIFTVYLTGRYRLRRKTKQALVVSLLVVLGTAVLAFTDNPVSRRCRDLGIVQTQLPQTLPAQAAVSPQLDRLPSSSFNSINFRLMTWRYAIKILHEHNAWVFGVSGGDSQALLDQKYLDAGMSQGYLGYNFHNEYIEILVRSGFLGAGVFMICLIMLIGAARPATNPTTANPTAGFTIALLLLLFGTESALEMQHILFLFAFFPILTGVGNKADPPSGLTASS
jgi:O-antigen ligase